MDQATAIHHLETLQAAIQNVVGAENAQEMTIIEDHGDGYPVLVWEGLWDWPATVGGGCSIYAGELNRWSKPQESAIEKAVDHVANQGCYFQADNGYTVSCWES